ncbi:hypothetical protein, partial [Cytobacillus praedii]|uniref:hypothetical protein n=1 Tax=Cytobacillus praedii TaxID=1742358 RepID=UPI001A98A254
MRMVKLYFKPETFKLYKNGESCSAHTERVFDTDIECEVDESTIQYSRGGFFAFINRDLKNTS